MELIAIICVRTAGVSMHKKNVFCRISKYTAAETNHDMARYASIRAAYINKLALAIIEQRLFYGIIKYTNKCYYTFVPNIHNGSFTLRHEPDHKLYRLIALSDIVIVTTEQIYMNKVTSQHSAWFGNGSTKLACVGLSCKYVNGKYYYKMRLPTRHNPICYCCHFIRAYAPSGASLGSSCCCATLLSSTRPHCIGVAFFWVLENFGSIIMCS